MRHSAYALALALSLCGCANMEALHSPPPPQRSEATTEDRDTVVAVLMASTFQSMQHLAQAGPAEQAEILAAARESYTRTPQGSAQLRYALMLATPGHPGRDPVLAQKLLRELAARPETLLPLERAVSLFELGQLNNELGLKADNERLQGEEQRADRERIGANQRRLQSELDENARLRKQLEDAQAKLDAIAKIERNLTQREAGNDGGQP
ncbi:MAG: hypothetical protein ABSH23_02750 [Steroidobacteraceae bacterium]